MCRIVFCLIAFSISCKAQDVSMTSPHEIPPYLLVRNDIYLDLPDSMNVATGLSALTILVDESGQVDQFVINKLQALRADNTQLVDYVSDDFEPKSKSQYPKEVLMYYDMIKKYISSLEIKKNEKHLNAINESQITFMVRFR